MTPYEELQESVITAQADKVKQMTSTLIDKGNKPLEIMSEGLIPAMTVVGQRFEAGELFIPEMLASAKALRGGLELLKPLIVGDELSAVYIGKVVIGTVHGDLHNIGKDIVAMMLETGGFTVINLGVDVPKDNFVEAVDREKPNILGISALLTTTMPRMGEIIDALKHSNLRDKVRIIIGGAPITQGFADSIGADGYASDAVSAVKKAKQLLG